MVKKTNSENLSLAHKWGRANTRRQNSTQTAKKKKKQTGIGLNQDLSIMPAITLKEIETIVSPYIPRPLATKVKNDQSNFYKFLIFDTETNTTIC